MIDLTGQHIFIGGGSRGIGAETARMAAKAGAAVSIAFQKNADAAANVVESIRHTGGKAVAYAGDLSVDGVADELVDSAVDALGPLTGMVVSAGIFESTPILEMTTVFWDRTMAVNLRATFLCVRAAVRHMRPQGHGGSIVFFTSTAGQRGSADFSAYATSKGGQILFMRSMARELGHDQIRVNCVAPAWTDTEMAAPSLDALGREEVAKAFVLGRIGRPDDVAGATLFLLSDLAKFITGTTVTVDGGMDMRG